MQNQTVLITGASSGIGKATAKQFAALGMNLILTARRIDRLQTDAKELSAHYGIRCIPYKLDVQLNSEVEGLFSMLASENIEIDILVNNAGLALSTDKFQDAKISNWETMIDTNIKGLLYMTKATVPSMIKRNRGHIINIGSVASLGAYPSGNVYSATKHAVKSITESLRIDLLGTKIRVTQIDPGAVETEFSEVRWDDKKRAKEFYEGFDPLTPEDIADTIIYAATRRPHVNIADIIIYPQAQASLRDLHRGGESTKSLFDEKK